MNISILGDGAWGSAISNLLSENGHDVTMWGPFPDYIEEIRLKHENPRFLPGGFRFKENITFTSDISTAVIGKDILVLALPSQYQRKLLENIKHHLNSEKQIVLNIAKGIENKTLERMSQVVIELLGNVKYAVLTGPSHAEEVCKNAPTAVVAASSCGETGELIQNTFMNNYFRVYLSDDPIGAELGGALKNVFAIAAGICDGMNLGDNSKAALVTRSIAEMTRLGKALGGKFETFSGLSGIGDMIVTCFSKHSRNRFVGEKLGQGLTLPQILEQLKLSVAEGIKTTESAYFLAKKYNIESPIIDQLYLALYENKNPRLCIKDLMTRKAAPEVY